MFEGTVAIGMPNHTCWANSNLSPPPRAGYYRVTTHPNALEFFGKWNGERWVHVTTKAAPIDAEPMDASFATNKTEWWRDLEESERSKFPWAEPEVQKTSTATFSIRLPKNVARVFPCVRTRTLNK